MKVNYGHQPPLRWLYLKALKIEYQELRLLLSQDNVLYPLSELSG